METNGTELVTDAVPLTQARFWRICNAIFGWPAQPASAEEKQAIVADMARKHGIANFVETGTYLGDMAEAQSKNFDNVITIELSDHLYETASARFANEKNIRVVHGDSGSVLESILKTINGPVLYWLDAHYSKGITARGEDEAPVLRELSIIASRQEHSDVILIDDARLFGWRPGYPSLLRIRRFVSEHVRDHEVSVISDIIHILPRLKATSS